jgi:hypothetical protein
VDKLNPDADAGKQHERGEALNQLIVACSDAACILRTIEEALDAVSQGIDSVVDGMLYFPGRGAGDFSFTTALLNLVANGLAVVALVTEHLVGITVDLLHQGREGGDIVRLPRRNHDADRQALRVGAGVDLGREAATRTAERVALGPPFPPAAQ